MKKVVCPGCNGTGQAWSYGIITEGEFKKCRICSGVGYLRSGVIEEKDEKEIGNPTP